MFKYKISKLLRKFFKFLVQPKTIRNFANKENQIINSEAVKFYVRNCSKLFIGIFTSSCDIVHLRQFLKVKKL